MASLVFNRVVKSILRLFLLVLLSGSLGLYGMVTCPINGTGEVVLVCVKDTQYKVFEKEYSKAIDMRSAQEFDAANGTNYISQIITDLEVITGLTYTVVNGFLQYRKSNEQIVTGSVLARTLLIKAIDQPKTARFSLNSNDGSYGSGDRFKLDVSQINGYIKGVSGALHEKTMGFGMMFICELLRTTISLELHHVLGSQVDSWGIIENAFITMNAIRAELGKDYGQRQSYAAYQESSGIKYIPFDLESNAYFTSRLTKLKNYSAMNPLYLYWKYISL